MRTDSLLLEAILWDMDGTLVDTEPMWVKCEEDLMRTFGYDWSEADALHCIGGPMERVQLYLKEKSGSDRDPAWFGETLVEMMLERLTEGATLRPGVHKLISTAQNAGVKMALVSASRRPIVDAVVKGLPFEFDLTISANEVTRSKPDPEGYIQASTALASAIHRCIVIEDSKVGITSGLASGAMVIGLTHESFDHENFHGFPDLSEVSLPMLVSTHRDWALRVLGEARS
jgi:HAD superfamily hydrolase (TIGR01509 family)